MDDKGSKYYYSRLSDGEKEIYNSICEALLRFEHVLVNTVLFVHSLSCFYK